VTVIALPGRAFHGHVVDLGNQRLALGAALRVQDALDDPAPEMRPA